MLFPSAGGDLVCDQAIGGVRIRDAQQSLRQTHQNDALGRCQVVLAQKGVEAGARRPRRAYRLNQRKAAGLHGGGVCGG